MASTYLSRTPSNAYYLKATFSFWFKRSGLGEMGLFGRKGSNATANLSTCHFSADDALLINFRDSGGTSQYYQITNRKFRDTSNWYHFHYIVDGDNSTQGDRSRLYINGVRETDFSLNNNPSGNSYQIATFLSSDGAFTVGRALRSQTNTFGNFDGLISHFHCSTGYAYEPTVFGETDATTGEWKIKTSPTFTPGTDGFTILKDGNTITDQSANSNDFSLTSGTLTKTEDCPSNVFATLNTLTRSGAALTIQKGNNSKVGSSTNSWRSIVSTLGVSTGKYYFEIKVDSIESSDPNNFAVGITDYEQTDNQSSTNGKFFAFSRGYGYYAGNGYKVNNDPAVANGSSYGNTFTTGDIVGCAFDLDNGKIYFSKNGTWQNSGDPTSGSTGTGSAFNITTGYTYFPVMAQYYSAEQYSFNFGNGYFGTTAVSSAGTNASNNGIFEYDVPTGYTALSTKGLNE